MLLTSGCAVYAALQPNQPGNIGPGIAILFGGCLGFCVVLMTIAWLVFWTRGVRKKAPPEKGKTLYLWAFFVIGAPFAALATSGIYATRAAVREITAGPYPQSLHLGDLILPILLIALHFTPALLTGYYAFIKKSK